jgi:hypothetical protein
MHEITDTITSHDLPHLRAAMLGYAADDVFGEGFRAVCHAVVAAIDQARDDDESTRAELQARLEAFVAAGNEELQRGALIAELCHQIVDADDTTDFVAALIALIPLLPQRHLMGVSIAIADALLEDGEMAIDLGLADLPAISDQLH